MKDRRNDGRTKDEEEEKEKEKEIERGEDKKGERNREKIEK